MCVYLTSHVVCACAFVVMCVCTGELEWEELHLCYVLCVHVVSVFMCWFVYLCEVCVCVRACIHIHAKTYTGKWSIL
jgi:hypothetical protein